MKKLNCVMTERQLRMCALILYAGGYDYEAAKTDPERGKLQEMMGEEH